MSEESDKLLGINRLPIFPLPLVLMPHELLPLHIFEPRYREMFADISAGNNLFGVSLFEAENEFDERPKIDSVGCVAEVRESNTLEDGRSNLLAVGLMRYRIKGYVEDERPYLNAYIDLFEDSEGELDNLDPLTEEVFESFRKLARAAHKMSGQRGEFPDIPMAPPEQLSFLVAAAFKLQNDAKYEMLETRSTERRLRRVRKILLEAVEQVEQSAKIDRIARTNGHGNKKIDL